ncbi:hypothetical protein NDU88_004736 [Pleurodeles waltl]|uniref:Uncharacterized protein n=1 Tax=Pleurodeles waltl TaxID=8319 RepID=A0AAV7QGZ3_PLEWA|nr:hypothetical protein NDU88_004736 [Pleurodeles waltl]
MGCNRGTQAMQTNSLEKYTVQLATTGSVRTAPTTGGSPGSGDPSLREIMDAIQALRNNIELKIYVVTLDVNVLRTDLCKVQRQRRHFKEVKRALRARDIKYMMIFPAKLKIVQDGRSRFFQSPEETSDWLEGWCKMERHGPVAHERQEREGLQDTPRQVQSSIEHQGSLNARGIDPSSTP